MTTDEHKSHKSHRQLGDAASQDKDLKICFVDFLYFYWSFFKEKNDTCSEILLSKCLLSRELIDTPSTIPTAKDEYCLKSNDLMCSTVILSSPSGVICDFPIAPLHPTDWLNVGGAEHSQSQKRKPKAKVLWPVYIYFLLEQ